MDTQEDILGEPLMRAFDIPLDATADEAARMLSERCDPSRYVNAVVPWPGAGMRVFLRLHAATIAKAGRTIAQPKLSAAEKEAAALQFIRDNREMTAKELCAGLKALDFVRSPGWVSAKRVDIIRADRRVS